MVEIGNAVFVYRPPGPTSGFIETMDKTDSKVIQLLNIDLVLPGPGCQMLKLFATESARLLKY